MMERFLRVASTSLGPGRIYKEAGAGGSVRLSTEVFRSNLTLLKKEETRGAGLKSQTLGRCEPTTGAVV